MVFERIRANAPISAAIVMMGVVALGLSRDRPPQVAVAPAPAAAPEPPACIDDTVELVGDGENAVLCWPGGTCWSDGHRVPHPAATPAVESIDAVVGSAHVCTRGHCDPLGPNLQRALLFASDVQVTRDHAALVLGVGPGAEVWNRVRDARIDVPAATRDQGAIVRLEVIGNRVMVSHVCYESCDATTTLIDANGVVQGWSFASSSEADTGRARQVALGGDRYVVFGLIGEINLIDSGTPVYSGWMYDEVPTQPHDVDPATVVLAPDRVAYLWCDYGGTRQCHVGRFEVGKRDVIARDDRVLPRCGDQSASSAATSAPSGATSSIP